VHQQDRNEQHMPHSEWTWIDAIRKKAGLDPRVPIGIGDDTALLKSSGSVLVTTDMLMDRVDFIVGQTPPELIGRKSLAVNLSDIAAMAGRPTGAVISLALPRDGGKQLAEQMYAGLLELARQFDCPIIGGDTNSWEGPLVVSVTVLGEPTGRGPVTRSGAKPGDWLLVTGPLGGSLPSQRHCTFTPRIAEAQKLHSLVDLHAMLDLSDGLASDLFHIAEASNIGIEIDAHRIPIHSDVAPSLSAKDRLHHGLSDGEDFELLFCVSQSDARKLLAQPPQGVNLTHIGRCTSDPGAWLLDGDSKQPLPRGGWEHQFS
jgi:thiamine-monophosphate kinase